MPLNSHINDIDTGAKGVLFVVATPIGNQKDITIRALEILAQVDLVAAEDTRKTGSFLLFHSIKTNLISYHEYNEKKRTPLLISKIKSGLSVALVSNAGTPSLSDPGYHLITEAISNKIKVVPIPGASAAITALSASGIPGGSFVFIGFLPRNKSKRKKILKELLKEKKIMVFYESPRRIIFFLEEIYGVMGDRYSVLSREMTKIHEEFIRGELSEIIIILKARSSIKGEFTILVSGCACEESVDIEKISKEIKNRLKETDSKVLNIAKEISKKYNVKKSMVYDMALKIKDTRI